jgi:hypothetical protein
MTLFYYILIAYGVRYNYPVPAESLKGCEGGENDQPYLAVVIWLIYVPGIKCKLWVSAMAYFVIHIKQTDDIF